MARYIPAYIVIGLLLSGCEALYSLGGMAGGQLGSAGLGGIQAKIEARTAWRAEHDRLAQAKTSMMERQATRLESEGKFDEAIKMYDRLLNDHEALFPELLIEKVVKRVEKPE